MELILSIIKAENVTIGNIRVIIFALEKEGFTVEALPSEITPKQLKITKG